MPKKPSVTLKCPANFHSMPEERIIEFSFLNGLGGLISFREIKGKSVIELYRIDKDIQIRVNDKTIEA